MTFLWAFFFENRTSKNSRLIFRCTYKVVRNGEHFFNSFFLGTKKLSEDIYCRTQWSNYSRDVSCLLKAVMMWQYDFVQIFECFFYNLIQQPWKLSRERFVDFSMVDDEEILLIPGENWIKEIFLKTKNWVCVDGLSFFILPMFSFFQMA